MDIYNKILFLFGNEFYDCIINKTNKNTVTVVDVYIYKKYMNLWRCVKVKLEEYMREIELMKKQNYTEYDMYSVIASLLREGENIKKHSLRDVNRRWSRTNRGKVFYGLSSIPDFAILDVDFINSENWINDVDKVYGCVEIKGIDKSLLSISEILEKISNDGKITLDEEQLLGEILWYKKVLYTNGLLWKFFYWNEDECAWKKIKALVQERINIENKVESEEEITEWYRSDKIDFNDILINEESLVTLSKDTTDKEWEVFLNKLYKIVWH